ncbi:MAG: hypothetical protein ACFE8A_10210 [Candidatus Hodarchaeota archaeon]
MKKSTTKIFFCLLIIHMFFTVCFLTNNSYAIIIDIEPDFGYAPEIDGDIDRSKKEWINATKEEISLTSLTPTDKGIPIKLWVMQNKSNLYISIQFELEKHESQEFIGILISDSEATSNESFVDAKILQFNDLGGINEKDEYLDYYILNNIFYKDRESNGEAAAKLDGKEIIYEFRIPVNNSDDDINDVFLDFGETYAFKIVYGENPNYPTSFKKSNIVLIDIEYLPKGEENPWILVHNILCIIIFIGLGGLFALYLYKIIVIKKKIRRVTE